MKVDSYFANFEPMHATQSITKLSKRNEAHAEFTKLLSAAETRGFHGTASITVSVQDGHIQHLKVLVERMIK
jgi:uncharacterized protein with FMN-binding domain